MRAIVLGTKARVLLLQSKIDARLGFPKSGQNVDAYGDPVADGTPGWPDAATGATQHAGHWIAHPNGTQWAHHFPVAWDPFLAALQAATGITLPAPVILDATWFPAIPASSVAVPQ